MKSLIKITLAICCAGAIVSLPVSTLAQSTNKDSTAPKAPDKKAASEKKEPSSKGQASIPFHGHLLELNKSARTFKIDKRLLKVTDETKIRRGDKEATLGDGIKGEYVTGSYSKGENGRLIVRSLYFGGKNDEKSKKKSTETKPAK